MSLSARLQNDLKEAMRSGELVRRDTVRLALAALKNRKIELGRDPDEGEELAVLAKEVKKREDSASQYAAAGRQELADRERAEIAVLQGYLPAQLGEDDVRALVREKIEALGLKKKGQIGQLMRAVMAEHKGQVDGKLVQRVAGELLA